MKLVLYSGYDEENTCLDRELVRLTGKTTPKVTFIPSAHFVPEHEFQYFSETFSDYGIKDIHIFNVDSPYSKFQEADALSSDLIYLSGGNTFYFLKSLKNHGFLEKLKQFVERGGVLSGLSAGAIIMTPNIKTASYPKFDRDDNNVKLREKDWGALGLCGFEFFPHYDREIEYARELIKESKKSIYPIFGAADGAGIVIEDRKTSFFGEVWCYFKGKEFCMNK